MITAGIDLAAKAKRTATAIIEWTGARAFIRDVARPAEDDAIVSLIEQADKTGIDCPFGWPDAFVHFVADHQSGQVSLPRTGTGGTWPRELTMRRTDAFVQEKLQVVPLSVSADKIAHVAMRCAVLLARLHNVGLAVDRSGIGPLVEVYPHASLRTWDLYRAGYKTDPDILGCLVDDLRANIGWLDYGPYEQTIRRSHDVFDAVIAAMTARAAALNHTIPPGRDDLLAARREGWIAIPNLPIAQLL
jgi:predicted nuclease with RNAse H fold